MKILFVPGNSPFPIFSHAPLATAARTAGHEVFMGGIEWVLPQIAAVGLPPVRISPLSTAEVAAFVESMPEDPVENAKAVGQVYAEIALSSLGPLTELARHWRPDVVVGGGMFYCAPLLAHRLGVPSVRLEWDRIDPRMYDPGAAGVLRPLLDEWGLDSVPDPDLWIDVCPPSLRPDDSPSGTRTMRWVPGNPQKPLEDWMYTRGDKPRIYITMGTRVFGADGLERLARNISGLGAEVVIGVSEEVAAPLRERLPDCRAGWTPLDVLAPTCDLIVHHGGGGTDMTALHSGTPQVIVDPEYPTSATRTIVEHGAAMLVESAGSDPDADAAAVTDACAKVLSDPGFRERARAVSAEMAALPTAAAMVAELETLVAR